MIQAWKALVGRKNRWLRKFDKDRLRSWWHRWRQYVVSTTGKIDFFRNYGAINGKMIGEIMETSFTIHDEEVRKAQLKAAAEEEEAELYFKEKDSQ